jgi:PAS domain S-box-containing protein
VWRRSIQQRYPGAAGFLPHVLLIGALLAGIYLTSLYSYLLFHALTEGFSIVIALGVFMIAWNSHRFVENHYLLFLGIAYACIAGIDGIHTLVYKGMNIFAGYDANLPTQLWIIARYLQAIALLIAPWFITHRLKRSVTLIGFACVAGLLVASAFAGLFPACYVEGVGLTPFKKISEYVISAILVGALIVLLRRRRAFDPSVLRLMILAISATICAELAFTAYVSVYGFANLLGHLFKILSFYFTYQAIIATGLRRPYSLLLREIKQSEIALRQAEAESRRAHEQISATLESISDAFFSLDEQMRVTYFNEAAEQVLGRRRAEVLGRPLFDIFSEARGSIFEREYARALQEKCALSFETYFDRPPLQNWYDVRVYPQKEGISVYFRVTTERKRQEQALAMEKERLAVTLRSIGDGMIAADAQGRVALMNAVAETLTGWTQAEALGRPLAEVFQLIDDRLRTPRPNPAEEVLQTGRVAQLPSHTLLIARDGTECAIADSGAPIQNAQGQFFGVVLVFRDETERLKMQDELLRAQKLESIGLLAGGIAHDFNNILTAIMGNIALAKLSLETDHAATELLTRSETASLRARNLTQQLLTFARGGAPIKKSASVAELLRETCSFALRGSRNRCDYQIAADLWPAEIDAGQISQVIHNLVINSDQAMPNGGVVHVRAENVTVTSELGLPVRPGRYVCISIRDQGVGIAPENLARIFDPYFSTKSHGRGLGLATSYSIVKNHAGLIYADSILGQGATFYVYLPASDHTPAEASRRPTAQKAAPASILVMDDEEALRQVVAELLERAGHHVVGVADGQAALDAYRRGREAGRPFDLVIMDMTIPGGMGGVEAIGKLLAYDPRAKALVSSGYANDPVLADFRQYGFRGLVAKPFQADDLYDAINHLLAS